MVIDWSALPCLFVWLLLQIGDGNTQRFGEELDCLFGVLFCVAFKPARHFAFLGLDRHNDVMAKIDRLAETQRGKAIT